jgi:hypothetical protein
MTEVISFIVLLIVLGVTFVLCLAALSLYKMTKKDEEDDNTTNK